MNSSSQHIISLPLDALIERLTLAGYEVSPRQRLQLWRVLQQFGADTINDPAQLKYRIAPLIATNAAEQEQFYQIFDKYLDDIHQYEPEAEQEEALRWWERIPAWAWAALLLLGLVALIAGLRYWLEQDDTPILQASFPRSVTIGESFTAQNRSTGYDSTTTTFRWELCDAETKEVEQSNEEHSDHWEVTVMEQGNSPDKMLRLIAQVGEERDTFRSGLRVQCANPPDYRAIVESKPSDTSRTVTFRLEGIVEEGFAYEWEFGDGNSTRGYPVTHTYQKEGAYEVKLNISRPDAEGYCSHQLSRRISIGQKEYAFLTFKQLHSDQPDRTAHFSTGIWLLMALIALLALYFWYRWLQQKPPPPDPERKARALQARFAHADQGPYQIPFRPQDDALRPGAELYRLAQVLRLRQEGLRTELDIPATIKNTIEQGGFPAVHLRRTTLPPNYLFLIDEQAPHSHQAQLYRYLLDFLRGQDVHIAAFWYKKTPARFWNAQYPKGLSLEQLQRLYPHYRLLVLGDAHAMLDPLAREQHQVQPELAANIRRWKSRLLLTPLPANDWTYREAAIYDQMAVFPSDTAGVESAMAYLETEHDEEDQRAMPSFANWKSAHSQPPLPPETNYQKWSRPETYEQYFAGRKELYRWFCALMVYPSPTWPLTLAIGKAIGAPLHFDNLLLLSRLPFLQGKPIPHRLRMQLLSKLDKETVQRARAAVTQELEAVAPTAKNSHANRKLQTQLAMQQFMLQPEEEEYREALRHLLDANALNKRDRAELEEGLQQQKGGQINLERFLSGKKQEVVLSKSRRPLNTDFYRALGLSTLLLVISVLVGILDGSGQLNQYLGANDTNTKAGFFWHSEIESDSALLFHNQAVTAWDSLQQQKAVLRPDELQGIAAGLQRALDYRSGNYPLAAANAARNDYHRGLLHYHKYLQDRDTLSAATASFYFERVRESDSLQADGLHALGLMAYYREDIAEATSYYNGLLAQGYFDTLQLQPNLRTLLFRMEGNAVQSDCLPQPVIEILSGDSLCLGDSLRLRINRDKANIDYYLVRWGDGQVDSLSEPGELSHVYRQLSGTIPVSVLSFGSCRGEPEVYSIRTELIVLQSPPDTGNGILASNTTGCAPLQVNFSAGTEATAGMRYEWDMGIGSSSDAQPSITYTSPGEYTVSLRLSNGCGEVEARQVIRVLSREECQASITVPGRVVDAEGGEGIPDARIVLKDFTILTSKPSEVDVTDFEATTDEEGRFEMKGLPANARQLQLLVQAAGYKSLELNHFPGKEPVLARMERMEQDIPGIIEEDKEDKEQLVNPNSGRIIYVVKNRDGRGTSWEDALPEVSMALSRAQAGDQIWVAAGTYYPTSGNDRGASFVIPDGVKLYGGFSRKAPNILPPNHETSIQETDAENNKTILSGNIGQPGDEDNSYNVIYTSGVSSSTVVNGFWIMGGRATGTEGSANRRTSGGGWYNDAMDGKTSSPVIRNCYFENNSARDGGAIYNNAMNGTCRAIINNVQFIQNRADFDGGAIYNNGMLGICSPSIQSCRFFENQANNGGAIANRGDDGQASPLIQRSRFEGNQATGRNPAIYNHPSPGGEAKPTLRSNTFSDAAYVPDNMVRIPGGTFMMGCLNEKRDGECNDDEKPAHEVTVPTFYMSAHEVTNEQFMVFLNAEGNQEEGGTTWYDERGSRSRIKQVKNGYEVELGYEQHPVTHVSWYAARAYARWLSEQTGQNYRLPTEAEWEYAARGGEEGAKDEFLYSGSNDIDAVAWYGGNSGDGTHPVGQKQPNQLGLYDMSGNVWEWVEDWYDSSYYQNSSNTNPKGPDTGSGRVLRGGSWYGEPAYLRCANRDNDSPDRRGNSLGFRLTRAAR